MRRLSSGATATSRAEMVYFLLSEQRNEREHTQRHMISVANSCTALGSTGSPLCHQNDVVDDQRICPLVHSDWLAVQGKRCREIVDRSRIEASAKALASLETGSPGRKRNTTCQATALGMRLSLWMAHPLALRQQATPSQI